MDWRQQARIHIFNAIAEAKQNGLEGDAIENHVRAAYPFGERAMHPYKIWLSEMRRQFPKKGPSAADVAPDYWTKLLGGETND
jgi:hypothetical protein